MNPALLMATGLETALNQYLRLDPEILPRVSALTGKVIALELSGIDLTLYLLPGPDGIQVVESHAGAPDVVIRGAPLSLARLARSAGAADAAAAGIEIRGSTYLGREFQELLGAVAIDWEEHLSRWVGDVAAHQLGKLARGALAWGRSTLAVLREDAVEYLQHESRDLPPSAAVEAFLNAVDVLRSDTDRLEARIRRLERALTGSS